MTSQPSQPSGSARFRPVEEAFERIAAADPTGGMALAVYVGGELVVDRFAGSADPASWRPWTHDTLAMIFSCTKGLAATCALVAAQAGDLDLDAPVARYWPEFARNGKESVTTRMVLSHSAGLCALDDQLTLRDLFDEATVARALERQRPLWRPGSGHAYHAMTFGWLVAEIVRRSTGEPLRKHFNRLFGTPGGDTWLGVADADLPRIATAAWDRDHSMLVFPRDEPDEHWTRRASVRAITMGNALSPELLGPGTGLNDPVVQRAGLPAVGAVSTARSLALAWSRTVQRTEDAGPLLLPATIEDATRCIAEGPTVLGTPGPWPRWGSGYMLDSEFSPMLTAHSFGHDGAGGQLAFADPVHGVGFAFVTNRLRNLHDDRARTLVGALRASLSERAGEAGPAPSTPARSA